MGNMSESIMNDVQIIDLETGECVISLESVNATIEKINNVNHDSYIHLPHEPIIIELSNPTLNGHALAYMFGLEGEEIIKKLIKLHKRTKSKRIKKKLNRRIIEEVYKCI